MALFGKKPKERKIPTELPPLSPTLKSPELRDLTARGFGASEVAARAEAARLRPAGPVFPRPSPAPLALPTGMPSPPAFKPAPPKTITAEIEEVAEAIIAEKWQRLSKEIDKLKERHEDLSAEMSGMGERMSNLEKKMDMVVQQVLGKVEEYGKGIADVGTELKAMQKVFKATMPAFTENIKELQELVGKAKRKRK